MSDSPRRLGLLLLLCALVVFWWLQLTGPRIEADSVPAGTPKALDAFEYHYPTYEWSYRAMAAGELPLWNPYQLAGIPGLATLQSGLLYPPHVVYLLLPTDFAMALSGLLHLLIAAASIWLLCQRLGLRPVAAILGAMLVAMRGAQPGHILNPSMQEAGAWLGVGCIGVLALADGRWRAGAAWIAGACGMSLLAGFPQLSVYSAYAWVFLLFALLVARRAPIAQAAKALPIAAAAVVLGASVAAVELLPALELSSVGGRARETLPLSLMLPFGAAGFETPAKALSNALASRPSLPGVAFTFGIVGLLLLPFAFAGRERRAPAIAFALLGFVCLVFALGPATPLFDWLLRLPEVGSFRNPWRILFVTDLCFAVVAAIGFDWLVRRTAGAAPSEGEARVPLASLGIAVAVPLALLIEVFMAPGNTKLMPYEANSPLLRALHTERPVLQSLAERPDRSWTFFLGDMGDVSEKIASVFRFRSISDVEILTLRRQREYFTYLFWGQLEPNRANRKGQSQNIFYGYYNILAPGVDAEGVAARSRLVELAAARHLLVPRTAAFTPAVRSYIDAKGLRPVDVRDPQIVLFEQPDALPRVVITHQALHAPDAETLLERLSQADFDPRRASYVEADPAALTSLSPATGPERVRIVRDERHVVEIEAELTTPGLVILADSFYPGWQADIDGNETTILATNHLFRGVVVPAGEHTLTFRYAPTSFRGGAALSLLGIGLLAWLGVSSRRRLS